MAALARILDGLVWVIHDEPYSWKRVYRPDAVHTFRGRDLTLTVMGTFDEEPLYETRERLIGFFIRRGFLLQTLTVYAKTDALSCAAVRIRTCPAQGAVSDDNDPDADFTEDEWEQMETRDHLRRVPLSKACDAVRHLMFTFPEHAAMQDWRAALRLAESTTEIDDVYPSETLANQLYPSLHDMTVMWQMYTFLNRREDGSAD